MKNYLFLLLLFCANIAHGQTNSATPDSLSVYKLNELLSTGQYESYGLDLNKDRLKDQVLVNTKQKAQYLYFFLQDMNGNYHCALKTWDFVFMANDEHIQSITKQDSSIVISIESMGRNHKHNKFYIGYTDGTWRLDQLLAESYAIDVDFARTDSCITEYGLDLPIEARNLRQLEYDHKEKKYREAQCYYSYKAASLDEFEQRFEQAMDADKPVLEYVERYRQLMAQFPLSSNNAEQYIRIAQLAEENELYAEAIYVLEPITVQLPWHEDAFLYLGDAYWGLGQEAEAKEAYNSYLSGMKMERQKRKDIPKRVHKRTK